jgi:putative hydrolase of the HAD superfamily
MIEKKSVQKHLRQMKPLPTCLKPGGALKKKIKCVLFDIYGTLFISGSGDISIADKKSPVIEKINQLLTKYSIRKSPQTLLNEFYRAIKTRHEELRSRGADFPEVNIDQIWMKVLSNNDTDIIRQFAVEFELVVNPVYPMPNLEKILSACRHGSILMGIISNAQFYTPYLFKWFLDSDLKGLGFDPDLIFYSYRFEVAKPAPMLFRIAAEKLTAKGIPPAGVLYLGNDMLNDIYPAKGAGFQTALFAGDKRSLRLRSDDPRCKNLSADLVITDLIQLIRHIQSNREKTGRSLRRALRS